MNDMLPLRGSDEEDEFLTPAEASALTKMSKATLRRLELADPAFPRPWRSPTRRKVLYSRKALAAYLKASQQTGGEPPPAWATESRPTGMPDYLQKKRSA